MNGSMKLSSIYSCHCEPGLALLGSGTQGDATGRHERHSGANLWRLHISDKSRRLTGKLIDCLQLIR